MARDFSSGNLNGGDLSFLDSLSAWSVYIEFNADTFSADGVLFEKAPSNFNDGINLSLDLSGPNAVNTIELYHLNTNRVASSVSNVVTTGSWQNVIASINWDQPNGVRLVVDGTNIAGSVRFDSYVNNTDPFLIGMHNNPADRRYFDGKIGRIYFWSKILTAAEEAALNTGVPPSSVAPDYIVRAWSLAGDSSPEPEGVDGTDTLTVTNATQVASESKTAAVLSSPVAETVNATDAIVAVDSTINGGVLHCYISTSATPPSAADLKAGTGATFKSTTVRSPFSFPLDVELIGDADNGDTDIGAIQAVATDGTYNFVSYSDKIYTYNASWTYLSDIDTTGINSGLHTQVNGLFAKDGQLFVTAHQHPAALAWIYIFDINPATGALTLDTFNSLSAGGLVEAPAYALGSWWIASHDKHGLDEYNDSWVHQGFRAFPAGTNPGTSQWQACVWFDDYVLVNVHNENANAPRSDIYHWDGSSFASHIIGALPPTVTSGQGVYPDGSGGLMWADRELLTLGSIKRTTVTYFPAVGTNRFAVAGIDTTSNAYYAHFLQDHGLAENIDSNIVTTASFGSGANHALTATSIESSSELSTPVINQVHALTPTSVESASETTSPTLSQTHALTATSVESTSQVSQPTVTDIPSGADHNLLPDDVESASEVTAPALGQVHVIAATDVESLSSVDSPSLAQIQVLLATGVECATELSSPALSDNGSVSLASLQAQLISIEAKVDQLLTDSGGTIFPVLTR